MTLEEQEKKSSSIFKKALLNYQQKMVLKKVLKKVFKKFIQKALRIQSYSKVKKRIAENIEIKLISKTTSLSEQNIKLMIEKT